MSPKLPDGIDDCIPVKIPLYAKANQFQMESRIPVLQMPTGKSKVIKTI
jgi:hypothetical protein